MFRNDLKNKSTRRSGSIYELGADQMGVDEMGSRRSGNKPPKVSGYSVGGSYFVLPILLSTI